MSVSPYTHVEWPELGGCSSAEETHRLAESGVMDAETDIGRADDNEEDGVMCAICHGNIQPLQAALVAGCDHPFCSACILNWSLQKQRCPLCNKSFTHVWLYRLLDGTYNDYLVEESVRLLHCSHWFRKAVVSEFTPKAPEDDEEGDYMEQLQYEYGGGRDYEEDLMFGLDMEDSILRGGRSSRRAFGNRIFGSGGALQCGRMRARTKVNFTPPKSKKKESGEEGCRLTGKHTGAAAGSSVESAGGTTHGGGTAAGSRVERQHSGYSRKAEAKAAKAMQRESQRDRRRELVHTKQIGRRGSGSGGLRPNMDEG